MALRKAANASAPGVMDNAAVPMALKIHAAMPPVSQLSAQPTNPPAAAARIIATISPISIRAVGPVTQYCVVVIDVTVGGMNGGFAAGPL